MDENDDKQLMLRFQREGDDAAFDRLFARHNHPLFRFILRLSGDAAVAQDISQQTWLRLIEAAGKNAFAPQRGTSFRGYVYAMARNLYVDEYHRKHQATRTRAMPEEVLVGLADKVGTVDDEAATVGREQTRLILEAALRELPIEQREVIAMWSSDMTVEEMSRIAGAPLDTVMSRKKYALAKLRAALAEAGIGLRDFA